MGWKPYGTPLVSSIICEDVVTSGDVQSLVHTMLSPMLRAENVGYPSFSSTRTSAAAASDLSPAAGSTKECAEPNLSARHGNGGSSGMTNLQKLPLVFVDENNVCIDLSVGEDKTLKYSSSSPSILVFIDWSKKLLKNYDTHCLENLPEVSRYGPTTKKARTEPLSLYTCLEAFLREEPLVPEDMWWVSTFTFHFYFQQFVSYGNHVYSLCVCAYSVAGDFLNIIDAFRSCVNILSGFN